MAKQIINAINLRRSITRIAVEIIERNNTFKSNLIFVNLEDAGQVIAHRLSSAIKDLEDVEVPVMTIKEITESNIELTNKVIVLVSKVISKGWLVERGINSVLSIGRPRLIQLAVLVDRGHRELPIGADYIGKNVPTSKSEFIEVHLFELDGEDSVYLQ